jgi:hypothetical protein
MSTRTSDSIELAVMRVLCKRFKGPIARACIDSLQDAEKYLALELDANSYEVPASFSKDFLLVSLLRKWKGWSTKNSPREVAIASWNSCEMSNFHTNMHLSGISRGESNHPRNFIFEVKRKIQEVIGAYPIYEKLDPLCRWSGGATFDIRRSNASTANKMFQPLTVTPRCLPHAQRVCADPVWNECFKSGNVEFNVVEGNRCVAVPKTAKTDRMIAAEPTANAFLQQGVGRFFRSRLKGFGVDLDDQKVNQDLAFRALVDNLSTLDLSCASDTLSLTLVGLLLPPAWYDYLCDLRSPKSYLDGKWYLLEKFSSMGNAFTFELESLIFWAISKTSCEFMGVPGPVSVYGDDIIVPKGAYDGVTKALTYFGFTVNNSKSFKEGPFFESCGAQFFNLEDVTPAFQKEVCNNDLFELIRFHNRLYRWGVRNDMALVKDALTAIITFAANKHKRLPYTPYIEGDFGFITEDSSKYKRNKHGDFHCLTLSVQQVAYWAVCDSVSLPLYAYKLRQPVYSNILPDGRVGIQLGEARILRWTRVWAHSVIVKDSGNRA